jgi:rhodanese-related sulfurtransferase
MELGLGFFRHGWYKDYGHIDAKGLKALMDTKTPMTILDARTDKWFKGVVIPGSKRLPSDYTLDQIKAALPHKNTLVIAYCAGEVCDASKNLVAKLVENGYTNVIDFHGGEHEWKEQGYAMEAYAKAS